MKFCGTLTTFVAFIGLTNALPAAIPGELTAEDILKLAEGQAPSSFDIRKRAACNADNALRALRDKRYSVSASAFCSAFIQSTITDVVSAPATITTETTETPPPTFVTVTEVSTLTEGDPTTVTSFIPTTEPLLAKRSEIPYPPWLAASYPPSRISSACSCFITAPSAPTHVTNTVITGTETAFSKTITLPPAVSTVTETIVTTVPPIVAIPKVIRCGVTPACRKADGGFMDIILGTTYEDCKTSCLNTSGCLSIQFGFQGSVVGSCVLGSYSVENTYAADVTPISPVCAWWYMDDVECIYLD